MNEKLEKLQAERQARLAALQAQRDAHEVEALELVEAAEAEHGIGRVAYVVTDDGPIVLSAPNPIAFRKFRDAGKTDEQALWALVRPSLLHPTADDLTKIDNRFPATLLACANVVVTLGGQRAAEVAVK